MNFEELQLAPRILKALAQCGHDTPTPIQEQAIPRILAGHDLLASAQTGTGKTAAFVLPALQRLAARGRAPKTGVRVLVISPTRELADQTTQVARNYGKYLKVHSLSIVGGMPFGDQIRALSQLPEMVIGTPGRLIDHIWRGRIDLSHVEMLVIDEADRMLDMGFVKDVEFLSEAVPQECQTLLFAATMSGATAELAKKYLKNPERVEIAPGKPTHDKIEQRLHLVDGVQHKNRLLDELCTDAAMTRAIIFSATKRGADRLARTLGAQGLAAAALHADMSQTARNRTVMDLRKGKIRLVVATDVAARGLDINGISHVINFDLPRSAEDYINRIGRTGRAGATGTAISFAAQAEFAFLDRIERYLGYSLPVRVVPGLEPAHPVRRQTNAAKGNPRQRPAASATKGRGKTKKSGISASGPAKSQTRGKRGTTVPPVKAAPDNTVEAAKARSVPAGQNRKRRAKRRNAAAKTSAGAATNFFGLNKRHNRNGKPQQAQSAT